MTDYLEIIIIEIPEVLKAYHKTPNDIVLQWMLFLDNPEKEDVAHIIEKTKILKRQKRQYRKLYKKLKKLPKKQKKKE